MVRAVFVAAHADLALGGSGILVAGMAGATRPVLWLRVEAGELLDLMTGRARRYAGGTLRAVGTMAAHAAAAELPVGTLLLGAVAIGAHFLDR